MAFTKHASLENVQVLELRSSPTKVRHASLGKLADFHQYKTDDGFLYARIRAISSRVNKNNDGWPSVELAGGPDVFDRHLGADGFTVHADSTRHYGFSTFLGKPIFVDHHNSDPQRARGVIVDAKFHVDDHRTSALDPYYSSSEVDPEHLPGTWVELLLEVDAKTFPKFAQAIVEGSRNPNKGIDGWSMGCDVDRSECSICKNSATNPEEYCKHIRMKGAYFDHADPRTGHKTSKRAYENCYGVRFFEISGVFDPADETALSLERIAKAKAKDPALQDLKEESLLDAAGELNEEYAEDTIEGIKRRKDKKGALHLAENPAPQGDMAHAPEKVDTLREETVCPVCGSSMDEDTCDVCSYQEPPEGFGNPDLTKARDVDVPTEPQDDPRMDAPNVDVNEGRIPQESAPNTNTPSNPALVAHVTGDMAWDVHTRTSGRINKNERPLISSEKPQTNEPSEKIVSDQLRPVTSRVRTAEDFIVAAGATRRNTMNHTADAASGAPAVAKPDVRTDVTGIGGVDQASNDAASKADAQVDVLAIGGTGVESVSAEKEGVEVTQGDEHSKNIEAIPTDTWGPGQGDSLGQQDPVTRQTPSWVNENRWSHWHVEGHEDGDLIAQEQQGGNTWADTGAPAVTGVKPIAEQFGDRVNVKDHVTSPANNSGPTTTWTGTDGNGVLKQQDPVTNESIALSESGLEGKPNWSTSSHIFQAFKLARLEVKLGMLGPDMEFQRAAELERETPERLTASLEYAQRVAKTATRVAGTQRLPVMGRPSATKEASVDTPSEDDSFLFGGLTP